MSNNALGALQGAFTPYDEVAVFTYNNGPKMETNFTAAQSARLGAVLERSKGKGRDPVYYDPTGHMGVHVAPDLERGKAGSEPTPEEAKAALKGYVSYFGTYSIDEQARTVTHHRTSSVQPGDVADLVRGFELTGDRLILRPLGGTQEVIWERIK